MIEPPEGCIATLIQTLFFSVNETGYAKTVLKRFQARNGDSNQQERKCALQILSSIGGALFLKN
jgi:predicted proteasome-type protease